MKMKRGGRPKHEYWEKAGFRLTKLDDKSVAFCTVCKQHLKNTAQHRLRMHRNVCLFAGLNDSEQTGSYKTENGIQRSRSILNWNETPKAGDFEVVYTITTSENDLTESNRHTKVIGRRSSTADSSGNMIIVRPSASISNESLKNLSLSQSPSTQIPRSSKGKRIMKGNSFVDSISPSEREELNLALACLIHGCNIPVSVVESEYFKEFIKLLRPAYRLPSRKSLSTSLLAKAYDKIALMKNEVCNQDAILLMDSGHSSGSQLNTVVCTIRNSADETLFINTYELPVESDAIMVMHDIIQDSLQGAKERYDANVYAVVSNNGSALAKTGRVVDLWHTTCNSYSANSLAEALLDSELATRVNNILKEFKDPELERAVTQRNGKKIVVAEDERWHSYRDAFACLLKNLNVMRDLNEEGVFKFETETARLLHDKVFELHVQNSLILLDAVCNLIITFQKPETNLADAIEAWLRVDISTENERYEAALRDTLNDVMNPFALAANYLHPLYRGEQFRGNDSCLDIIEDFLIDQLDEAGLTSLDDFKAKRGIFSQLFDKHLKCPRTFWSMAKRKHRELSNLAEKLLRIPASK